MIFSDSSCRGNSIRVDMTDPQRTYLGRDELYALGLNNDSASSAMVPLGYSLFLYDNDGQQGQMEQVDGYPIDYDGVMVCQNLSMNDKMTSLSYYKTAVGTYPVNGRWQSQGILSGGT
jgi:hypothetical protein